MGGVTLNRWKSKHTNAFQRFKI